MYTYKYNDETREFEVYCNNERVLIDKQIRDREDLLCELEEFAPCILMVVADEK